ncbi:MAG: DUF1015 domain-containing protein [Candidatus Binatia bacterium]|jgi:uncharacterized protein (DUF1015 family)|nr:DUF1015 domain-containing protein [Candidatus Binatia bacterium]
MARIAPFRGTVYNQKKIRDVSKVIAPPYDVITPEERERLTKRSPYNIVHLILNQDPEPYQSAARTFEQWQSEEILVRDDTPAIYFLSHRFTLKEKAIERLGFIALMRLEDFSTGSIHPHENTMAGPKEDRTRLMMNCHANLSQIFGLYSQPKGTLTQLLSEHVLGVPPVIEAGDRERGSCRLWRMTDGEMIRLVQCQLEDGPLLIADGHHRYEAAMNYRRNLSAQRGQGSGREAFNYVMMYFANMAESGLVILPTHRLVRDFPPIPFQKLEEDLLRYFYLEPYPKTREGQSWFLRALKSGGKKQRLLGASFKGDPRYLIFRLKNKRILQRLAKDMSAPVRELDVTVLHHLILEHILGLSPEEQTKEGAIRYLENDKEALDGVDKGENRAAFILNSPRSEDILTVALSGEKMPQKSTYFFPKLFTGLVINKFDPNEEIQTEVNQ